MNTIEHPQKKGDAFPTPVQIYTTQNKYSYNKRLYPNKYKFV